MKKIRNKVSVIAIVCVCTLSICCAVNSTQFGGYIVAAEENAVAEEEKVECTATIEDDFDDGSILVVLDKKTSAENNEYSITSFGNIGAYSVEDLTYMGDRTEEYEYLDTENFHQILQIHLLTDSKQNVLDVAEKVAQVDGVLWAGPNYYGEIASLPSNASGSRYSSLWGLHGTYGIQAKSAWDITTGNDLIKVGVIDTGIAAHANLSANLTTGYDFYNNNSTTTDDTEGHGTHVAGIIGASATTANGVVGVCWNVTLVPLQVIITKEGDDQGFWETAGIVEAITYAAVNEIDVLNYSGGSIVDYECIKNAIANYSGLFVCAAGNNASDNDNTKFYPSDYSDLTNGSYSTVSSKVISVGAIKSDGSIPTVVDWGYDSEGNPQGSNYSSSGNTVSIYAPGNYILSTVPTSVDSSGYVYSDGTSMAAPFVTGVAALLLSMNPGLTAAELKTSIINGGIDWSYTVNGTTYSAKRLSALGALNYAEANYDYESGYIRMSVVGNSNGWQVKLTNINDETAYVQYNSKMCFAGDAVDYSALSDIQEIAIDPCSGKTVTISANGTAGYITASVGCVVDGVHYRKITYANGLSSSASYGMSYTTNAIQHKTVEIDKDFPTISSLPSYLRLTVSGKTSGVWSVIITNSSSNGVQVTYNKKMCLVADAKTFDGCDDLATIKIGPASSTTVSISENGFAGYITARIDYYYHNFACSKVTYANGLSTSSSSVTSNYNIIYY